MESVAFIVCDAPGLDTSDYSFRYVAAWSDGDVGRIKETGERVLHGATQILGRWRADPEAGWKALAEENPEVYSTGTVRGVLANLIDPSGVPKGDTNGGVTLVQKNGVFVALGGDGSISLAELIEITESMEEVRE